MLRRIGATVLDLTHHAAAARELSLGVYSAALFLLRGQSDIDIVFARHDARIRRELSGG
jgi:hypothetical protein